MPTLICPDGYNPEDPPFENVEGLINSGIYTRQQAEDVVALLVAEPWRLERLTDLDGSDHIAVRDTLLFLAAEMQAGTGDSPL